MDDSRFDDLARLLGAGMTRRGGLRTALGGLLGLGAGAAALDADAKRRRDRDDADADASRKGRGKRCRPACADGYECVKVGKKRECQCPTGVICGDACCRIGQVCEGGACVAEPEPVQCIPAGEPCKGVGKPCCDGRVCSSGQGGQDDIACYVHKTGACRTTADCVYGTACIDGRCGLDVPPPAALGAPCNPDVGQQCATPGAVCAAYDGPDAPSGQSGAHCTLPLGKTCSGDPDCTCYKCGYPNGGVSGTQAGAEARATGTSSGGLSCCGPAGYACQSDGNCCLGAVCVNGTCQSETTCDVCQGGGCPYSSIVDAVRNKPNGSTVTVAPGTYDEPPLLLGGNDPASIPPRNLTIRRCGLSGTVLWQSDNTLANTAYLITISGTNATSNFEVTFVGLKFNRRTATPSTYGAFSIAGNDPIRVKVVMMDCEFDGQQSTPVNVGNFADLEIYDSAFTNGSMGAGPPWGAAGAIYVGAGGRTSTLRAVRSRFTDNVSPLWSGAIYNDGAAVTLVDTLISGNRCTQSAGASPSQNYHYGGGGIFLERRGTLTLEGSSKITGNSVPDQVGTGGSGIAAATSSLGSAPAKRMFGVTSATCTGNTPASQNCAMWIKDQFDTGTSDVVVPVSCDTWCLPSGTPISRFSDPGACCSGVIFDKKCT